jgi:hypothetical protein
MYEVNIVFIAVVVNKNTPALNAILASSPVK